MFKKSNPKTKNGEIANKNKNCGKKNNSKIRTIEEIISALFP